MEPSAGINGFFHINGKDVKVYDNDRMVVMKLKKGSASQYLTATTSHGSYQEIPKAVLITENFAPLGMKNHPKGICNSLSAVGGFCHFWS